ncbi:hypothetical protein Mgra_00001328 [Meloidogyne graminicola]|uniref:glucuronosyltransferase n=1 Tax=Meloidogyne graminicola TaxID=189291 RepID=A0A8T0A1A7_9BILA|nr:hypothetical protein Mgra_00001328 [Meloidogyne graminicola]
MKTYFILTTLFLLSFPQIYVNASKILVFSPTISRSHMISNARIADTLAADGHNVTLVEVEFIELVGELNASKHANTLLVPGRFMNLDGFNVSALAKMSFLDVELTTQFIFGSILQTKFNEACERFLIASEKLFDRLRAENFEVIMTEQLNFCGTGVGHLLGIPTHILISSCPIQEHVASILGLSNPSSYIPSLFDSDLSDKMSIYQRMTNLIRQLVGYVYTIYGIDPLTQIFRKHYGSTFPDLRDIVAESPFVFVNVDELVDFPRPIFSNIVYIGGLGISEENKNKNGKNELQEPFNKEMSKGKKGIIFFSMGTIMQTKDMDENFRRNVLKAFSQLPDYHFIMKISKDDTLTLNITKSVKNVFVTEWAPQNAILKHPRLKLFITHGGYNSIMESARAGIPLIAMGFFADQYRNARVAERNGWALPFDKKLLLGGSDEFKESILKVIESQSYMESAKRTQRLVLNKPFSAEERLLRSIRFLELGSGKLPELLPESRNMGMITLYNLDIAVLIFISLTLILALFVIIFRILLQFLAHKGSIIVNTIRAVFFSGGGIRSDNEYKKRD